MTSAAAASRPETVSSHAAFIWSVADLLRGDYKQSEYGKVVLPITVLRRLEAPPTRGTHKRAPAHIRRVRRQVPANPLLKRRGLDNQDPGEQAQLRSPGVRERAARRSGAEAPRDRRLLTKAPTGQRLRHHRRAAPNTLGRRRLAIHQHEPRQRRRAQPTAETHRDRAVHPQRTRPARSRAGPLEAIPNRRSPRPWLLLSVPGPGKATRPRSRREGVARGAGLRCLPSPQRP